MGTPPTHKAVSKIIRDFEVLFWGGQLAFYWHETCLVPGMQHALNHSARGSWLSLVAETAGVSGATIARVELHSVDSVARAPRSQRGASLSLRAVIQIQDAWGDVVGATYWYGNEEDLAGGVAVDLGCDFHVSPGSRVVAWIDDQQTVCSARQALAPQHASEQAFEPFKGMKLGLHKDPDSSQKPSVFPRDRHLEDAPVPAEAA